MDGCFPTALGRQSTFSNSPGYDVKLIRCCPQYDVKLMWRHQGNDIVSVFFYFYINIFLDYIQHTRGHEMLFKLMWRHQGNDIVSVAAICVAAICAAAQLIFLFGRTRLAV